MFATKRSKQRGRGGGVTRRPVRKGGAAAGPSPRFVLAAVAAGMVVGGVATPPEAPADQAAERVREIVAEPAEPAEAHAQANDGTPREIEALVTLTIS